MKKTIKKAAVKKTRTAKSLIKSVPAKKATPNMVVLKKPTTKLTEDIKEYNSLMLIFSFLKKKHERNLKKIADLQSYTGSYNKTFQLSNAEVLVKSIKITKGIVVGGAMNAVPFDDEEKNELACRFSMLSMFLEAFSSRISVSIKKLEEEFAIAEFLVFRTRHTSRKTLRSLVKLEYFIEIQRSENYATAENLSGIEKELDSIVRSFEKLKGNSEKNRKSVN